MTLEEFQKADIRVGTIISSEPVEGSEKLLKLQVDLGEQDESGLPRPRQILAGVAKAYGPALLPGKQCVFIVNLEPRMIMGLESQGMLLAPSDATGDAVVLMPEREVPPGAKIK